MKSVRYADPSRSAHNIPVSEWKKNDSPEYHDHLDSSIYVARHFCPSVDLQKPNQDRIQVGQVSKTFFSAKVNLVVSKANQLKALIKMALN